MIKKKTSRPTKKTTKKKTTKARVAKKSSGTKRVTKKKTAKKVTTRKVTKKKVTSKKATKKKVTKKPVTKKKAAKVVSAKARAKVLPKVAPEKHAPPPKAKPKPKPKRKEPDYAAILKRLPYKVNDHVVHPRYGLGLIKRISEQVMNETNVPCFGIHFSYQEMRLTIPVDQVEKSGLRNPMNLETVAEVFKVMRGRATFDGKQRSAKRVADYQKRVHLGDPISLAEVVRDLSRLALKKTLSYEERKILSEAMRVLSREVALTKGTSSADIVEEIEVIVNR